jgi:4-hydroxy-tetrahydrodipicolinate synthase
VWLTLVGICVTMPGIDRGLLGRDGEAVVDKRKRLEGIVVAMVTPFNDDESLDEEGLRAVVRFLVERGVHGLFPAGSQGEFYALAADEWRRVLDITLEIAGGRVLVMAHAGAVTTREAIALARYAEAAGADVVSAITPFFVAPTQEELYRHYADLAAAVSLPVLAYNNPARTGVNLLPTTVARLVRDALNFVGLKDSSGDLSQFVETMRLCPPGFRAFMGRDSLIFAALAHGAAGAVAASANVVPELVVSIYDATAVTAAVGLWPGHFSGDDQGGDGDDRSAGRASPRAGGAAERGGPPAAARRAGAGGGDRLGRRTG